MEIPFWLYILIPLVAFLYASVGHGGASGYLAVMALAGFAPQQIRTETLILNTIVSLLSFYYFYKAGNMNWRLFLWLILGSVPAAFVGGNIHLETDVYRKILGVLLFLPALKFLLPEPKNRKAGMMPLPYVLTALGAGIGLLSGLIGIGGGVLLSPVLILTGMANVKTTAAVSALFITVNSLAGLGGAFSGNLQGNAPVLEFVLLAVVGGISGASMGARSFSNATIKYLLSAVLLLAAIKLLMI